MNNSTHLTTNKTTSQEEHQKGFYDFFLKQAQGLHAAGVCRSHTKSDPLLLKMAEESNCLKSQTFISPGELSAPARLRQELLDLSIQK